MGGGGCVLLSTGGTSAPVLWLSAASSHDSIKVGRGKGLNLWGSKYRVKPVSVTTGTFTGFWVGGLGQAGLVAVSPSGSCYRTGESMLQTSP